MSTPLSHDPVLHRSYLLGASPFVPDCPACRSEHRRQGWRLLAVFAAVAMLGLGAYLVPGTPGLLLGALALVLVYLPLPPLSRWVRSGSLRRS